MDDKKYYLGFSAFSGIGPIKFKTLLIEFGSAKNIWYSSIDDLSKIIGKKLAFKFDKFRNNFSLTDYERKLVKKKVWFLCLNDKNYPKLLKEISNPPIVLYGKGKLPINDRIIAVVGARKTTQYGREVTKIITQGLVQNCFTIVSGLALGVDAVAATTAIEQEGKTIAVLGSGVDVCHPSTNINIYNSIVKNSGAIVSEVPLGQTPTKGLFPARNRIIAGLSLGVLVTEGEEDSGSLITADYAFKFNRKVFAVPGPINSRFSKGPYKLIQKGAKLVTSAEDILKEFKYQKSNIKNANKKLKIKGNTREEQEIIKILENESLHFDEIVRRLKLEPSVIGSTLSLLEMKGYVNNENGIYDLR